MRDRSSWCLLSEYAAEMLYVYDAAWDVRGRPVEKARSAKAGVRCDEFGCMPTRLAEIAGV